MVYNNGLVTGFASKGYIPIGVVYTPLLWNDSGEYSYFYIDFKEGVDSFSIGMLRESILVYGSSSLATIISFNKVSPRLYKIYIDSLLNTFTRGVAIINVKNTKLEYLAGQSVSPFSTMFYVNGIPMTLEVPMKYDVGTVPSMQFLTHMENEVSSIILVEVFTAAGPFETVSIAELNFKHTASLITEAAMFIITTEGDPIIIIP